MQSEVLTGSAQNIQCVLLTDSGECRVPGLTERTNSTEKATDTQ